MFTPAHDSVSAGGRSLGDVTPFHLLQNLLHYKLFNIAMVQYKNQSGARMLESPLAGGDGTLLIETPCVASTRREYYSTIIVVCQCYGLSIAYNSAHQKIISACLSISFSFCSSISSGRFLQEQLGKRTHLSLQV